MEVNAKLSGLTSYITTIYLFLSLCLIQLLHLLIIIAQTKFYERTLPPDLWHTIKPVNIRRANDTRWNSTYFELLDVYNLRIAFETFIQEERKVAFRHKKEPRSDWPKDEEHACNAIIKDHVEEDDWEIIAHYIALLEPLWIATKELEGRPGDGKAAGLINVQWDIERILEHLTAAYNTYGPAPSDTIEGQWHFSAQIKLALDKCKAYYAKLDDSAAVLAATVLHPARGWPFIKEMWKKQPTWITTGKERVELLWQSQYAGEEVAIERVIMKPLNLMEEHRAKGFTQPTERMMRSNCNDDYARWLCRRPISCNNPIEWWSTDGAKLYPQLAKMALDLLSVPAMSDEAERIFSRLTLMITNRRNHIEQPTIQASQCLFSWDKAGIINLTTAQAPAGHATATP